MKDYSVLSDLHTCQWAQLVTAYDKGYEQGYVEGQKHDLEHTENIVRSHEKCKSVLEAEYNRGVNDLWESVCKFMDADITLGKEIWGCITWEKFAQLSPSEVIERLKEYNKKQEPIVRCCKNCKHSKNGMVGSTERCKSCYYDGQLKGNTLFESMETDNCVEIGDEVRNSTNNHIGIVVKNVDENSVKIISSWGNTGIWELKNCNKTGKCFKDFAERLLSLQDDE